VVVGGGVDVVVELGAMAKSIRNSTIEQLAENTIVEK